MVNKVYVLLFLAIIYLPLIFNILRIDLGYESKENRSLSVHPELQFDHLRKSRSFSGKTMGLFNDVMQFKSQYDAFYSDNFILKAPMFILYRTIKADILMTDPIPEKVVEGDDGWYFLGDFYSNAIKESKLSLQFNESQLDLIKSNQLKQKTWLADAGVKYYVAIAPSKHSIYNEKLPIIKSQRETKIDQIKSKLSPVIGLIDMTSGLKDNEEILFHKTNSHWNDLGAFLGYQEMVYQIRKDFPEIKPLSLDDFERAIKVSYEEDLTKMLYARVHEDKIILTNRNPNASRIERKVNIPEGNKKQSDYFIKYRSGVNDLKIMIFRDSFSTALIQFVSETFGESVFVWSYTLDKELIVKEKPDILILEMVDHNVDVLLNSIRPIN